MVYLSVSDVLERSWELTKKYGIVLVIVYLVLYLIQYFVGSLFTPPIDVDALQSALEDQDYNAIMKMYYSNPTGMIVSTILTAIVMLGFKNCLLQLAKGTATEVAFDHWKQDVGVYVKYVVIEIIVKFVCGIGYVFCVIPGIYLDARLQFASIHVLNHPDEDIMGCIKASWNMTGGNVMNLILLILASAVILIVGLICCCIGFIPAAVICSFAEVVAYLILSGWYNKQEETEVAL